MRQLMHSFVGTQVPAPLLAALRQGEVCAICLFAANVESPAHLRTLSETIRQAAHEGGQLPPLIGIDQEGGQLIAVTGGATELPGNMALGATRSPELAKQAGGVLARELLAMGVNLNFAPSLDVNINPANPVIGVRSFGDDPAQVAQLGTAMIRGMQSEGVIATAKHFPGHGDTRVDSHNVAPVVDHTLERMSRVELLPFRAAIAQGVGAIMTAHVIFPALDPDHPATLSSKVLDDLLRRELGFEGLIITDALDMRAVSQGGALQGVSGALRAGVDLALLGHIRGQFEIDTSLREEVNPQALARIAAAQRQLSATLPDLSVVGCAEHQAIAQAIADKSITVVRDNGQLPLRVSPDECLAVITPRPANLTPADTSADVQIRLADAICKRHPHVLPLELPDALTDNHIAAMIEAVSSAIAIIVGTVSAEPDSSQARLVRALHQAGRKPIVIAMRTPYDILAFPMVDTYLCTYSIRPVSMEAVARVLFGEIRAEGVLPCAIPNPA